MSCETLFQLVPTRHTEYSLERREQFETLLRANPQCVHARDYSEHTLLHWAANANQTYIVELLLALGADVNARTQDGHTPLYRAAAMPSVEAAERLLAHGADPNLLTNSDQSPLFSAGWFDWKPQQSERLTSLLLEHGANPHQRDINYNVPLHSMRCLGALRQMLRYDVDVNAQNKQGETPLLVAVREGYDDIAKALIAAGANVNICNAEGQTLLHLAVLDEDYGNARTARLLLKLGANINARDHAGRTPLHQAAGSHFAPGVRLLLASGAEVNVRDAEGHTPLYAAEEGFYLGTNPYYAPPPEGEGDPKNFAKGRKKIAMLLQAAGGQT